MPGSRHQTEELEMGKGDRDIFQQPANQTGDGKTNLNKKYGY